MRIELEHGIQLLRVVPDAGVVALDRLAESADLIGAVPIAVRAAAAANAHRLA